MRWITATSQLTFMFLQRTTGQLERIIIPQTITYRTTLGLFYGRAHVAEGDVSIIILATGAGSYVNSRHAIVKAAIGAITV